MTVVEITFPAGGRLHATPWGRHVNEGATEWPPSPWRLLRALVATWYLKARNDVKQETIAALIDALSQDLPHFELPPAVQSHTRHYMPGRGTDKPKVFDTFVQSCKPLRMVWQVDLDQTQRGALTVLCERMGYLGRAESIVDAKLLSEGTVVQANSTPLTFGADVPHGWELVKLLCPVTPPAHAEWLAKRQQVQDGKPKAKKGKGKGTTLPRTIFEALHAETAALQAEGWLIPPGSRHADYVRKSDAFQPEKLRAPKASNKRVTVARFAVASAVLPRITKAVSVAERLHQALAKWADGLECAEVFTGKGKNGEALIGNNHTYIFCELGDKRDSIGFITLFARAGFSPEAQRVIEDVQRKPLWGHGGHDLNLILLGFGDETTFQTSLFGPAKKWVSLTPFVATRHAKHYGDGRPKMDEEGWQIGSPAQDLRRLIKLEKQQAPKSVLAAPGNSIRVRKDRVLKALEFQMQRYHGGGRHGHHSGTAFEIEFDTPLSGPMAFGYGAHFGLGLFVPAD
jgi:CRISPR-associated protein Csb2